MVNCPVECSGRRCRQPMLVRAETIEEGRKMGRHSRRSVCLLSLALLAAVLGACKMGPDYVRPETPKADAWRVPTSTSESIANLAWWDLLKDKELQELIRIALAENQDVRTAVASVEQYRAQLVMTRWD